MRFASYPIVRAAASIAILFCLLGVERAAAADAAPPAGSGVVGFLDDTGKTLFLHDFEGRPVLINLWATWCAPCVAEMPSLAKLQQDYASKGLVVIALSEDDSVTTAQDFLRTHSLSLGTYFDKGHAVWLALESRGVPTTVLVTRKGDMVERVEGPVDWNSPQVHEMIDQLVK